MNINIFNFSKEKKIAKILAEKIEKDLPSELFIKQRKILSANKITQILENTFENAKIYRDENKPGSIKKAIIANNFKWELKNIGYPEDFINIATEGLIVEMSKK